MTNSPSWVQIPPITTAALTLYNEWSMGYLYSQQQQQPDTLWHYTTAEGLLGIISSGEFWATNTAFLNDRTEIKHTLKIAKCLLEEKKQELKLQQPLSESLEKGFSAMNDTIDSFDKHIAVYVVSSCEYKDLLSQWRAYGSGGGYAISLNRSKLNELVIKKFNQINNINNMDFSAPWVSLVRAVYDETDQKKQTDILLSKWVNLFTQPDNWGGEQDITKSQIQLLFAKCLSYLALSFKDHSFEEEYEWRLIYGSQRKFIKNGTGYKVEVRTRNNVLLPFVKIPYIEMPNNEWPATDSSEKFETQLSPISKVLIGPTQDPDNAEYAVKTLLESWGYKHPENMVEQSEVPLRW